MNQGKFFSFINAAILLFIAYAVVQGVTSPQVKSALPFADGLSGFLSTDKEVLHQDTVDGSGTPAMCGQTAWLVYSERDVMDTAAKPARKDMTLRLGEGKLGKAAEQRVLGMKLGGKRVAFVEQDGKQTVMEIEMKSLSPTLTHSALPVRGFTSRTGKGEKALCGDKVRLDTEVWDGHAERVGKKETLEMVLGDGRFPVGLEQGVLGMKEGEIRTIIIPPAYVAPLRPEKAPAMQLKLPSNEVIMVDVTRLAEVENKPEPQPTSEQ